MLPSSKPAICEIRSRSVIGSQSSQKSLKLNQRDASPPQNDYESAAGGISDLNKWKTLDFTSEKSNGNGIHFKNRLKTIKQTKGKNLSLWDQMALADANKHKMEE